MSFSNTMETAILQYIADGTVPFFDSNTDFWIALHSADPGEAGTAITSEISTGGYARKAVTRATDLSVSGNTLTNVNLEQFLTCTSGSTTVTHASLVNTSSGAGTILMRFELVDPIPVQLGIQPQFAANTLNFTLD